MKLAMAILALALVAAGQTTTNVLVRAVLVNDRLDQKPVPTLSLSFEPAAGGPAIVANTNFSGRAVLQLSEGKYLLVSGRAVPFDGAMYRWQLPVTITGATQEIDLSNTNAERTAAPKPPPSSTSPRRRASAAATLRAQYQRLLPTIVTVWTDLGRGSGVIVDPAGLIVTSDRVVMDAGYVAVQFDAQHKVLARILVEDRIGDIAVIRANLAAFPQARAAILASAAELASVQAGDRVFTIGDPLSAGKLLTTSSVSAVGPQMFFSGIKMQAGDSGGPLFDAAGHVIGITTEAGAMIKISRAAPTLEKARAAISADPPSAALLPVTPELPYPPTALQQAAWATFRIKDYEFGEGVFQVQVLTPPLAAWLREHRISAAAGARWRKSRDRGDAPEFDSVPAIQVRESTAPVVEVDVFPKLRATKKSMLLHWELRVPVHERYRADFEHMDLLCGTRIVTPILPAKSVLETGLGAQGRKRSVARDVLPWPFVSAASSEHLDTREGPSASGEGSAELPSRVNDVSGSAFMGAYRYGPGAFDPACGTMSLILYSSFGTHVTRKKLKPQLVQRVWDSFAPWRATRTPGGSR
ncbi:MAG: trypsin-like peptidase domain-containing protein [Terriglobales bacterium]